MSFDELRSRFQPLEMRIEANNDDELKIIQPGAGRLAYHEPPVDPAAVSFAQSLPTSVESAAPERYLWVVDRADVPHALEHCDWASQLESGCLKHSNLTGGAAAFFGGELWFIDEKSIVINFCSGRYGAGPIEGPNAADDEARMAATVAALIEDGYRVATTGQDLESGFLSAPIMIGPIVWQDATNGV